MSLDIPVVLCQTKMDKQRKKNGLSQAQFSVTGGAIRKIIHSYTREAGVRSLERKIGELCRKAARELLEGKKKTVKVTERNLEKYLGRELIRFDKANKEDLVGIVRGLAWKFKDSAVCISDRQA